MLTIDKDIRTGREYRRLPRCCAVLSAATGLCYAVAFIVLEDLPFERGSAAGRPGADHSGTGRGVRPAARRGRGRRLGLTLGVVGAVGSAIHGGYDLAISLPVAAGPWTRRTRSTRGGCSPSAPRDSACSMSWLIRRGGPFPRPLGYLSLAELLLVVLYLARLIGARPGPLVLGPALLTGFVLNPLLYGWLGYCLSRAATLPVSRAAAAPR